MIDSDPLRFSVRVLKDWRAQAENTAGIRMKRGSAYRRIKPGEVFQELRIGEVLLLRELAEEFGCEVEPYVWIATTSGNRITFNGAVVRGEDLIGIDMFEVRANGGFPFFRVEHLIELLINYKFERFKTVVLILAIVSDAFPAELDELIRTKLSSLADAAPFEVRLRMYRLPEASACKHSSDDAACTLQGNCRLALACVSSENHGKE